MAARPIAHRMLRTYGDHGEAITADYLDYLCTTRESWIKEP